MIFLKGFGIGRCGFDVLFNDEIYVLVVSLYHL